MPSESSFQDHATEASKVGALGFAVITLSDTRTDATDESGKFIKHAVAAAGHHVVLYRVLKEDRIKIKSTLQDCLADHQVHVIVTNGGTGISSRDSTIEVMASMLDKQIEGFGELFRNLSYQEIGPAAMMSRALGGIAKNRVLFAIPGSTNAVRLAMEKLILPQAAHIFWELNKHLRAT
jgi:molybdenum cofactor biosynthesis protein B